MFLKGKLEVDCISEEGETALTVTLNYGQKEAFHLLVKHGADPNKRPKPKPQERIWTLGCTSGFCLPFASRGLCENSLLWRTLKFRDLEWCELLIEAGCDTTKDEEDGGWIEVLRSHVASIEMQKEEGIDLSQHPFNLIYANFFTWYDTIGQRIRYSLAHACRQSIRGRLMQLSGGRSIYRIIDEGVERTMPRPLRNFLILQDSVDTDKDWLEVYKAKQAITLEKIFFLVDDDDEGGGASKRERW